MVNIVKIPGGSCDECVAWLVSVVSNSPEKEQTNCLDIKLLGPYLQKWTATVVQHKRPSEADLLNPGHQDEEEQIMDKYECTVCGYVYDPAEGDPDNGVDPGTSFEDLPDDWTCPVCGAGKEDFEKEG